MERKTSAGLPGWRAGVLALLLAAGAVPAAHAQSRVATSAAPFLTLGTGARGSALGHAYTAVATGADALYWNPAGAARQYDPRNRGSVFFSHTAYLADVNYNAFGAVVPVTATGVIGLSIAQLDAGRMNVTTVDFPGGTGETFGVSALVAGLSYAQPLTSAFHIGGTFKYVREAIYDMSADAMAFDIGFVLESQYFNGLRLGASIMNFGGQMQMSGVNARVFVDPDPASSGNNDAVPGQYETGKWDLPLSFKFGAAVSALRTSNLRLDLLTDAHQTNDNNLNADLGAELLLTQSTVNLNLRLGYKDLALRNVDSHLSYGGGVDLRLSGLRLGADFAFVPYQDLGNVSMVDVKLYF